MRVHTGGKVGPCSGKGKFLKTRILFDLQSIFYFRHTEKSRKIDLGGIEDIGSQSQEKGQTA